MPRRFCCTEDLRAEVACNQYSTGGPVSPSESLKAGFDVRDASSGLFYFVIAPTLHDDFSSRWRTCHSTTKSVRQSEPNFPLSLSLFLSYVGNAAASITFNVSRRHSPIAMRGIHLAPLRCAIWRRHEPLITLLAARTARQPCTTMWEMRGNGNGSRSGRRRVEKRFLHIAPVLMPPIIFGGLFVALWCWKCMMMVLCQNYIIYNPFLPPNARGMRIDEYVRECGGIGWREERIRSLDGTELALCVAEVTPPRNIAKNQRVYILYFQGSSRFAKLGLRAGNLTLSLRECFFASATTTRFVLGAASPAGYGQWRTLHNGLP